jgi:hypothetical protein
VQLCCIVALPAGVGYVLATQQPLSSLRPAQHTCYYCSPSSASTDNLPPKVGYCDSFRPRMRQQLPRAGTLFNSSSPCGWWATFSRFDSMLIIIFFCSILIVVNSHAVKRYHTYSRCLHQYITYSTWRQCGETDCLRTFNLAVNSVSGSQLFKVKCTLLHALGLCTGRTVHRWVEV